MTTQHIKHTELSQYIITVKLDKNPNHNPNQKIPGICPLGGYCTDVTGAHHSQVAKFPSVGEARTFYESLGYHVTRIEKVGLGTA
jgi:hypothetical protein